MGVGFGGQLQTGLTGGIARSGDFSQYTPVIGGVANDSYVVPVLGSRAQHRRTAYVDFLDSLSHSGTLFGNRLAERIEVHAYHIDELDTVLFERLQVGRLVAACQQRTMHFRVEGLDTSVAYLWEARYLRNTDGMYACVLQQPLRTARGDNLPTVLLQALYELY